MFAWLGTLSVLVGLGAGGYLAVAGFRAARNEEAAAGADLRRPALVLLIAAVVAMVSLEGAILSNEFTMAYVANHHSTTTPFVFKIATAWSALEGSIVLWGLVLAGYTWAVLRSFERTRDRLGAGALAVLGAIAVFFFGLMVTVADPFTVCVQAAARSCAAASPFPWVAAHGPVDGPGPNPLLQNHLLVAVHPPLLYLGYVGMSVPFAFAVSALAIGLPGAEWLRRTRRWTLIAWTFLTLGIVFGGWWSYEVLSWGGYWAWDPVENASFMPWLVATAFLHSSLVQARRGMLQAWNFVLVIGAFSLTILGTFLTRSGTIASVHSFTQSPIGPTLLGFLVLVLAGSFGLFATRSHLVASSPRLESLSSREGSFLFNNLLLTVYAVVVLVGTLYPLLVEAFTNQTVGVGRPFFDRLAIPLSFGLILAMGVGPVMPWRVAKPSLVWRRVHGPLNVALLAGVLVVVTTSRIGWVVLAVVVAVFLMAVIVRHLWDQAARGAAARGSSLGAEVVRLFRSEPGFWGGQVSHLGVALVAVGIAFSSNLAVHANASMQPGDTVSFAGYALTYRAPYQRQDPNKVEQGADIVVARGGKVVAEMRPHLNTFTAMGATVGTPAVWTRPSGDLYLVLHSISPAGIELEMNTSPLQWVMWLGGLLTAAGASYSVLARRRRTAATRAREEAPARA